MIVERQNNELLVRLPILESSIKMQSILDYLRYVELTSKSTIKQEDSDKLVQSIKQNRWQSILKRLKL